MRRRRRDRSKHHFGLRWIFLGIFLAFILYITVFQGTVPKAPTIALFPSPTPTVPPPNMIEPLVRAQLRDAKGNYGVVIKNMKNKDQYSLNPHRKFETASLYKMWVLAIIYQQIEKGQLHEDDVLTADIKELNKEFDIPEELAEQKAGTTSYTVKEAVTKMITISDNYASLLLTHTVTYPGITAFLEQAGLNESQVGIGESSPTSTPNDAALFFEKLYTHQLANKTNTDKMLDLLKKNEFNTIIPKYIPVSVAHKTGSLDYFSHDAGIVFTPKGDYIIALMSESGVPPAAEERMAKISESVYTYFKNKVEPEEKKTSGWNIVWGVIGVASLLLCLAIVKSRTNTRRIMD